MAHGTKRGRRAMRRKRGGGGGAKDQGRAPSKSRRGGGGDPPSLKGRPPLRAPHRPPSPKTPTSRRAQAHAHASLLNQPNKQASAASRDRRRTQKKKKQQEEGLFPLSFFFRDAKRDAPRARGRRRAQRPGGRRDALGGPAAAEALPQHPRVPGAFVLRRRRVGLPPPLPARRGLVVSLDRSPKSLSPFSKPQTKKRRAPRS